MPLPRFALLACALALLVPASAQGANFVSMDSTGVASVNEQNANGSTMTVALESPGTFRLTDAAATSTGVPPCADDPGDAKVVRCVNPNGAATPLPRIDATLGAGNDTWTPATPNAISWPQVLEGGPGQDTLTGSQGDDRFLVRDGEQDTITCGAGSDVVEGDTVDVVAADCESRPGTSTPTPTPTPTPAPGPATNPLAPKPVSLAKTFTVPAALPRRTRSKKYKFTSVADLERDIARGGVAIDLVKRAVTFRRVPNQFRRGVDDQDIVALSPRPGAKLAQNLARPPKLTVSYFDEAEDLFDTQQTCPYREKVGARKQPFAEVLEDQALDAALKILDDGNCRYQIDQTLKRSTLLREEVRKAAVGVIKSGSRRQLYVSLIVERPTRTRDLILSTTARPADERGQSGYDYAGELSRGMEDGAFTAGARNVVSVQVRSAATGEPVRDTEVELYDADGKQVASQKTSGGGARTFTATFAKSGTARIVARITTKQGRIVEGYQDVPVKTRSERFCGEDGRRFAKGSRGWRETDAVFACTKAEALRQSLAAAAASLGRINAGVAAIGRSLGAGGDPAKLIDAAGDAGLLVARVGINAKADGTLNAPAAQGGLRAILLPAGGSPAATGTTNGLQIPANGLTADLASFISTNGGNLISERGGALISDKGSGLIGDDSAGLIGNDSAGLLNVAASLNAGIVDADQARLITVPLVGNDGASVIARDGASLQLLTSARAGLISDNGLGIISDNGGGILSNANGAFVPVSRLG